MKSISTMGAIALSLLLLAGCGEEGTTETSAKKAAEDVKAAATTAKDKAAEGLSKAGEKVKETATEAATKAQEAVSSAGEKVKELSVEAKDKASEALSKTGEQAKGAVPIKMRRMA